MKILQKFRKTGFLAFSMVIAAAMLLSAFVFLPANNVASDGIVSYNPADYLRQFQGRQFPNERPPRDDLVAAQAAGIPLDASTAEADALLEEWYDSFYSRKIKSGPNPMAYAERMAALERAESSGRSVQAVDAISGTAKMLMIPFQFGGTDNIPGCAELGGTQAFTATVTGPMKGTIPDPALAGDNNSIYAPGGDFTISWYTALMFGNGITTPVRTDLNGGAGVNLSGVSATKWYQEQSEGVYNLDGDIYKDWITLDHSVAWYGWNGNEQDPGGQGVPCNGTPSGRGFEFVSDIADKLNTADPAFDWAQYDVHGPNDQGPPDGIVDHLMVIHSGVDNSAGGGTYGNYQIWAHSWDVYTPVYSGSEIINYTLGYLVQGGDTTTTTDDIYIANYTVIPEDADVGVVVHEYGHDIGLPDYYDTSYATSNSTAHWIVMSGGSWSGELGGSHPAPFNPWARNFFGWETPLRLDYTAAMTTVTIGQSEPTPNNTEDSVWIDLPDQSVTVENMAGSGKGRHAVLGNQVFYTMTKQFDLSTAVSPTFVFSTDFTIEEDWDYTYIRASVDGTNWDILLNQEGEYATVDPNGSFAWRGAGGLTGHYRGQLTYNLSSYAGQSSVWLQFAYVTDQGVQDPGIWVDDFVLSDGATVLYENNLDDVSDWSINNWEEVPYNNVFPHYYMLEWRNDSGSIAQHGQGYQYYSLAHAGDGWKVDKFSANVPGLLVWYRNNFYDNNQALGGGREFHSPASGPKGELLLVDSHNDPVVWSHGWWDPVAGARAQTFSNRRGAMDGAFTLNPVPAWDIHDKAVFTETVMDFGSRPAVSAFNDSQRSVPGWVFPGDGFVYRTDNHASVVIPAAKDYSTRIRSLAADGKNLGADLTSLWGFTVAGQVLGSGNPGDSNAQYGVSVELVEQAGDGSWGKIMIKNQKIEIMSSVTPTEIIQTATGVYTITYKTMVKNTGTSNANGITVTYTLDANLNQISFGSMPGGAGAIQAPATWYGDLAAGEMVTITLVATGTSDIMGSFGGDMPIVHSTTVDTFDGQNWLTPVPLNTSVTAPSIKFTSPTDGQMIGTLDMTTTVPIQVSISDFFNVPGDGHWHLLVDDEAWPGTPIMTYTTSISLAKGVHTLEAKLVNSAHLWLGPSDKVTVTVKTYSLFLPIVMKNYSPSGTVALP